MINLTKRIERDSRVLRCQAGLFASQMDRLSCPTRLRVREKSRAGKGIACCAGVVSTRRSGLGWADTGVKDVLAGSDGPPVAMPEPEEAVPTRHAPADPRTDMLVKSGSGRKQQIPRIYSPLSKRMALLCPSQKGTATRRFAPCR